MTKKTKEKNHRHIIHILIGPTDRESAEDFAIEIQDLLDVNRRKIGAAISIEFDTD